MKYLIQKVVTKLFIKFGNKCEICCNPSIHNVCSEDCADYANHIAMSNSEDYFYCYMDDEEYSEDENGMYVNTDELTEELNDRISFEESLCEGMKIHLFRRKGMFTIVATHPESVTIEAKHEQWVVSKSDVKCLAGGKHNKHLSRC